MISSEDEECAAIYEVTVVNEAKDAVFKILDLSKEGNEKELVHQCSILLSALEEIRESSRPLIDASNNQNDSHSGAAVSKSHDSSMSTNQEKNDEAFIRTNMVDYNNKRRTMNNNDIDSKSKVVTQKQSIGIREVFGSSPNILHNLAQCFGSLITHRVETCNLLPTIQNEEENEDVITTEGNKTALTLTKLSMVAARTYLKIIGMNGSWGMGLIDVGSLSGISALVRRWGVECRGREKSIIGGTSKQKRRHVTDSSLRKIKKGRGESYRLNSEDKFCKDNKNKRKLKDRKRGHDDKRNRIDHYSIETLSLNDIDTTMQPVPYTDKTRFLDNNYSDNEEQDHHHFWSEYEMIISGLNIGLELSNASKLVEFRNWSADAREAYIDASLSALATVSALSLSFKGTADKNCSAAFLCQDVISLLTSSIQTCVVLFGFNPCNEKGIIVRETPRTDKKNKNKDNFNEADSNLSSLKIIPSANTEYENTLFVLRGLYPIFSCKEETPNGVNGKEAARKIATLVVEGMIEYISKDLKKVLQMQLPSTRSTSGKIFSSNAFIRTPTIARKPPESGQKVRKIGNKCATPSIPSLKKSATPNRVRRKSFANSCNRTNSTKTQRNGIISDCHATQLRKVLKLFEGLMQKLATSKYLEKASVRKSTSIIIKRMLCQLPVNEQSHFLEFLVQLCQSRISSHRLFGVELAGEILTMKFLWSNHFLEFQITSKNVPQSLKNYQEDFRSTGKNHSCGSRQRKKSLHDYDKSLPGLILLTITKRLSDRVPAVRARSAQSISDAVKVIISNDVTHSPLNEDDEEEISIGEIESIQFKQCIHDIDSEITFSLRERATCDEKAIVRRAATSAWVNILRSSSLLDNNEKFSFTNLLISSSDVAILSQLCSDSSVSVRKSAVEGLTLILQKQFDKVDGKSNIQTGLLENAWADSVLPLVMDTELSCISKVVDAFSLVVIDPIVDAHAQDTKQILPYQKLRQLTAWRILSCVSQGSTAGGAKGGAKSLSLALGKLFDKIGQSNRNISVPLLRVVHHTAKESILDNSFILYNVGKEQTQSHTNKDDIEAQKVGSWFLLDVLTQYASQKSVKKSGAVVLSGNTKVFNLGKVMKKSALDSTFLVSSWEKMNEISSNVDSERICRKSFITTSLSCLHIIAQLAPYISMPDANSLFFSLKKLLLAFRLSPDLILAALSAIGMLTERKCSNVVDCDVKNAYLEWIDVILLKCENVLVSFTSHANSVSCPTVERAIFTIGEVTLIGFSNDENVDFFRISTKKKTNKQFISQQDGAEIQVAPSEKIIYFIQALVLPTLPMLFCDNTKMKSTPSSVRAHAFATLGKLCLRSEHLASENINIFAQEMHQTISNSSPAIRSNSLLALGDLCVRYTNLADKFLPIMASCLQVGLISLNESSSVRCFITEKFSIVRKHAVLLLSSLILQDYIKWRGLLFHRFLVTVVDSDENVSRLAAFLLCGPLLSKQPSLFCNNFVESVFVLNGYTSHPIYSSASGTESVNENFIGFEDVNIMGVDGKIQRMKIYSLLLSRLTDVEKIEITARLVKEILGAANGSSGHLSYVCRKPMNSIIPSPHQGKNNVKQTKQIERAHHVLSDCFAILICPDIHVGRASRNSDVENEDTHQSLLASGPSASQISVVKTRLLSKISRKHLIEIVVPILCSLKITLEKSCSCLLKDLMEYMLLIFRQFKVEVKDVLADTTFLQELEYDARKFEKERKKSNNADEIVIMENHDK